MKLSHKIALSTWKSELWLHTLNGSKCKIDPIMGGIKKAKYEEKWGVYIAKSVISSIGTLLSIGHPLFGCESDEHPTLLGADCTSSHLAKATLGISKYKMRFGRLLTWFLPQHFANTFDFFCWGNHGFWNIYRNLRNWAVWGISCWFDVLEIQLVVSRHVNDPPLWRATVTSKNVPKDDRGMAPAAELMIARRILSTSHPHEMMVKFHHSSPSLNPTESNWMVNPQWCG